MKKITRIIIIFCIYFNTSAQNAPEQPTQGPGGNNYLHNSYTFTKFGTDIYDCYWLVEPAEPKPDSAFVIVYWHGTNQQSNIDNVPSGNALTLEHICRKGYTVIFPLYQYGGVTLPFEEQLTNGANVVNLALNTLQNGNGRVRPKKNNQGKVMLGAVGISRGGGMTLNAAAYHQTLNLPSFDALCAVVPSAGQDLTGIIDSTKVIIVNGEENELNFNESQEAFDSLHHIPCPNKRFIQINSDYYGNPDLVSNHDFAGSGNDPNDNTKLNALDYYGMWKLSVALFDCTFKNENCEYCFGRDTLITYMGHWSDGTPVKVSTIKDDCSPPIPTALEFSIDTSPICFPNPTTEYIFINKNYTNNETYVFNSTGSIVFQQKNCKKIHFYEKPKGLYLLMLKTDKGTFYEKIVKK
ncbi:MAG: T9SS type A sorting domain-containing protein [Thermonemataceae bacterium]|nr:T9SS type A sorting domain-containing protein [Thermonemataceae bacterium]